jgi:hypothetical protein
MEEPTQDYTPRAVVVTDINVPLSSIAIFMLRWAIASIPAFILLTMIALAILLAVSMLFGMGWTMLRTTPLAPR